MILFHYVVVYKIYLHNIYQSFVVKIVKLCNNHDSYVTFRTADRRLNFFIKFN